MQARELLYELDHDDDKVLSWHEAVPLLLDIWALTLAHAVRCMLHAHAHAASAGSLHCHGEYAHFHARPALLS